MANQRESKEPKARERRWFVLNNSGIHGVRHSELVVLRTKPHHSMTRSTVSVLTISRTLVIAMLLTVGVVCLLLFTACQAPKPLGGGAAKTVIQGQGHGTSATLAQSDNPKEPSTQTVSSEQTLEYVLPAGTAVELGTGSQDPRAGFTEQRQVTFRQGADHRPNALDDGVEPGIRDQMPVSTTFRLPRPVPVRVASKDRTETRVGGAQRDTVREYAVKAANLQPVMWAGIAMMTLVAGALAYFGWWTKAGIALGIGIAMVILAQTLPDHGSVILLGGLTVFALAALLVLYAYHKGQLDTDHDGIPDLLQKKA